MGPSTRASLRCLGVGLALLLSASQAGAYLSGLDTRINEQDDDQFNPAAAYSIADGGTFLVVYRTGHPAEAIWGQRVEEDGTPVGDPFVITSVNTGLPLALSYGSNSNTFLAVWSDQRDWDTNGYDIYARLISGTHNGGDGGGQFIGGEIALAAYDENQARPMIGFDTEHNQFLVVWEDKRVLGIPNNDPWICGRLVSGVDGSTVGGEIQISNGDFGMSSPSIDYSPPDDSFLVVFSDLSHHTYWAQRVSHTGGLVGSVFEIDGFPVGVERTAVRFGAGLSRLLVAYYDNGYLWAQRVSGVRDAGDGGGQFLGSAVRLGDANNFTIANIDYVPDLGHWIVVWDDSDEPYRSRGCWVAADGTTLMGDVSGGDFPLSRENDIVVTHSVSGRDAPFIFQSSGIYGPGTSRKIHMRELPQHFLSGNGETERRDFLHTQVSSAGWNLFTLLPEEGYHGHLSVYNDVVFFWGDPLAEGPSRGHSFPQMIAVAGTQTGTMDLNVLVEFIAPSPSDYGSTYRVQRDFPIGAFNGHGSITSTLDSETDIADLYNLNSVAGEEYVINAIPLTNHMDIGVALFDAGTVPVAWYRDLDDAVLARDARTPGYVETIYLNSSMSETETLALAVTVTSGAGSYELVVRDPDEPTTEELVKYLLGLAPAPWGGDVNGDYGTIPDIYGIDVADVVANIEAGR